ncbi:MAG: hypothetical protein UY85_C0066G0003 [Candidatus Peribacteria bacterium GW2011_GWB1_54_5]|nr:MAG: hypothetical protein UY85_C0066G0003 [Candidatus Peribacteria bacterium GW2011_GWB1_54_5]KKW44071.1 MAG: hypothetical protein UY90_C0021G0002 [Candidatus Peregrinibacteria bacterium GW2011_GWA2_54_9]
MCFILASGIREQSFFAPLYQCFFLPSAPPLYLLLARDRIIGTWEFLEENKFERPPFVCITSRKHPCMVLCYTRFKVTRDSRVVAPVAAPKYVHIVLIHTYMVSSRSAGRIISTMISTSVSPDVFFSGTGSFSRGLSCCQTAGYRALSPVPVATTLR